MEHTTAVELIRECLDSLLPVQWTDLGAGSGTFTKALAEHLKPGSVIIAIDDDEKALTTIPPHFNGVQIRKDVCNFLSDTWKPPVSDGFMLANSFHFVPDKLALLKKLKSSLNPHGSIIIVEYDTETPSRWIPYPLPWISLRDLSARATFSSIRKGSERPSLYGDWNIYSAVIGEK